MFFFPPSISTTTVSVWPFICSCLHYCNSILPGLHDYNPISLKFTSKSSPEWSFQNLKLRTFILQGFLMYRISSELPHVTVSPSKSFHGRCSLFSSNLSLYIYMWHLYSAIIVFPSCTVLYFCTYCSFCVACLPFYFSASSRNWLLYVSVFWLSNKPVMCPFCLGLGTLLLELLWWIHFGEYGPVLPV